MTSEENEAVVRRFFEEVWNNQKLEVVDMRTTALVASLTLLLVLPASGAPRSFKCKEPLPEFTLGEKSNPSDTEIDKLCACIWSKLPEGGWERDVAVKSNRGEDPGWRWRGFVTRFGTAMRACGADRL